MIGLAAAGLDALLVTPGNPVLRWSEHRVAGIVFSHVAVGLLALGVAPHVWAALRRRAAWPARLARDLLLVWVATAAALTALVVAVPDYARELVGREWGLVEPLQFVLHVGAAALCFAHARLLTRATAPYRLYRGFGWVALVLALEEIDWLGLWSTLARLAGLARGRVGRQHLGGLHDLVNIVASHPETWLPAAFAGLAFGLLLVWVGRRVGGALAAEVAAPEALLLVVAAALMAFAQVMDVRDELVQAFHRQGWPTGKLVEEPSELLAILALDAWLALRFARRYAAREPRDVAAAPARLTPGPGRSTA